jgi:hypothetical protein
MTLEGRQHEQGESITMGQQSWVNSFNELSFPKCILVYKKISIFDNSQRTTPFSHVRRAVGSDEVVHSQSANGVPARGT